MVQKESQVFLFNFSTLTIDELKNREKTETVIQNMKANEDKYINE